MGLAVSYAGRLGLTAWRRKSTLLGLALCLVVLVLCLQYNVASRPVDEKQRHEAAEAAVAAVNPKVDGEPHADELKQLHRSLQAGKPLDTNEVLVQDDLDNDIGGGDGGVGGGAGGERAGSVQFVQPGQIAKEISGVEIAGGSSNVVMIEGRQVDGNGEQPAAIANLGSHFDGSSTAGPPGFNAYDQQGLYQMGIPFVNLDAKYPYVPAHRLIHLDLKGAPPKVSFLKKLFPLIRKLGGTGVLLEWEDMFPFTGPLAGIVAGNAYSKSEVRDIIDSALENHLEVIPLVQTFGHVEFALKHSEFASLREVPESPQALCPSLNQSMTFVEQIIEQVMAVHKRARFLHIGCDEVFQMGECPRCRSQMRESLFLTHVARVAAFVRKRYRAPDGAPVVPIIWDDMLRHISPQSLDEFHIGQLVEPMVWVYAEDVYRFVPSMVWDKYAAVFPTIWSASAYKGAFGETLYLPNVKRHLENNLRWLEVMTAESRKFQQGFRGIAITGWQRYDHFAVLCELLPGAVPSLAVTLLATSSGYFNQSLRQPLMTAMNCPAVTRMNAGPIVSLNTDPYLGDRFYRCYFPGASFFKLLLRLHATEAEVKEYLESVTKAKGWMTDYNIRRNFSSPLRVDELMAEHPRIYHALKVLARSARESMVEAFDAYTIAEWVEQRIYPYIRALEELRRDAAALKAARVWPRRPFPPLTILRQYGVPMPGDPDEEDKAQRVPPADNANEPLTNK